MKTVRGPWRARWLAPMLVALASAALAGCDGSPSTGATGSARPGAGTGTLPSGSPTADGAAPSATVSSAQAASQPMATASAATPRAAELPGARCTAAGGTSSVFLGRLLHIDGQIVGVDRLGLLVEQEPRRVADARSLQRLAKDAPADPPLAQPPPHQVVVANAAEYWVNEHSSQEQGIYYLEPQPRPPFNSRLLYLRAGEQPPAAPKMLLDDAHHVIGEWDGWLYVLRLHPGFIREGLTPGQAEAVGSAVSYVDNYAGLTRGSWWRFHYDLVRVRRDGTSQVVHGDVQRTIDTYFDGHVYGRSYDGTGHELSVFRIPAAGGQAEVLYRRPTTGQGRGTGDDRIGPLSVDRDGVFFVDAAEGDVRRIALTGGAPQVLKRDLRYGASAELIGDTLLLGYAFWEGRFGITKDGGPVTWQGAQGETLFGKGHSGCAEVWLTVRDGNLEFVLGARASPIADSWDGRPTGFVYQYLPGGTVNARMFALRPGYAPRGPLGVDEQCLYYTAGDGSNTWFYALPRPAI
jgi:hypothetical protein